jgi:transketolase
MTEAVEALDQLAIDTIRTLSMDAVQKANSGHPGAPMGMAPMAYTLWTRYLRHAPSEPAWPNRDRFVLSAGHASMLLYSLLYLTGYGLTLEDLKSFRQLGSLTPGHPEHGHTRGVEATTGPLGQGFANGVGMAIAQDRLATEFNRPGHDLIDHYVYGICSDGDLQEGVAAEAASLAGHLKLGRIVYLYDDNHIQLDGPTAMAFSDRTRERFDSYGWHTAAVEDGNDIAAIDAAIAAARTDERPSLIAVRTHIGYGAPTKHDSQKAHGSPLGEEEVRGAKVFYGWDPDKHFFVPEAALALFREAVPAGQKLVDDWREQLARYASDYPAEADQLERRLAASLPQGWTKNLKTYTIGDGLATRKASSEAINALAGTLPELFGGAADLSESNLTDVDGGGMFEADRPGGRNIRFGVREHGMGAIANGISLYGGFIPYVGTFLTFSDYMRGAVRLAALTRLQVVYVWTHDSIGLGEDGPTHQPVEQVAALRAIPNLTVIRPGDANETVAAWICAVERRDGPTALILTRQKLPVLPGTAEKARPGVARGGYVLREASGDTARPDLIAIATGSELQLAMAAAEALEKEGIRTRVVSLPSWERFEAQDDSYRDSVLPRGCRKRVTIEALSPFAWERYAGDEGAIVGVDHFGASAPAEAIFEAFGITAEHLIEIGRQVVRDGLRGRIATGSVGSARAAAGSAGSAAGSAGSTRAAGSH